MRKIRSLEIERRDRLPQLGTVRFEINQLCDKFPALKSIKDGGKS
jgi:hypothetical protein